MEQMNLFGIPVWYDGSIVYGQMTRDSTGGNAYMTYNDFNPAFLEVAAESMSKESFIDHVKGLLELAQDPESWAEVRHTFGFVDDDDKEEALKNTRELLEQILESMDEENEEQKEDA
jgi:flagellar biosynthesis regulator FlbT